MSINDDDDHHHDDDDDDVVDNVDNHRRNRIRQHLAAHVCLVSMSAESSECAFCSPSAPPHYLTLSLFLLPSLLDLSLRFPLNANEVELLPL